MSNEIYDKVPTRDCCELKSLDQFSGIFLKLIGYKYPFKKYIK